MRIPPSCCLVGLVFLLAGCGPLADVTRTILVEPAEYSRRFDAMIEWKRHRRLADIAWREFVATTGSDCSADFARGFKEGFTQYLFAGGTGNPPPLPPRHYWRPEYQTPEGQKAILDWFAGYRRGATVARESNYRTLVTIPPSASLIKPHAPAPPKVPPPVALPAVLAPPEAEAEHLPLPRPIPPDDEELSEVEGRPEAESPPMSSGPQLPAAPMTPLPVPPGPPGAGLEKPPAPRPGGR